MVCTPNLLPFKRPITSHCSQKIFCVYTGNFKLAEIGERKNAAHVEQLVNKVEGDVALRVLSNNNDPQYKLSSFNVGAVRGIVESITLPDDTFLQVQSQDSKEGKIHSRKLEVELFFKVEPDLPMSDERLHEFQSAVVKVLSKLSFTQSYETLKQEALHIVSNGNLKRSMNSTDSWPIQIDAQTQESAITFHCSTDGRCNSKWGSGLLKTPKM